MSVPQVETPMMRQFNAIKREHPDKLLFYRMGDFYEMFGDDAIVGAEILQIALTSRDKKKKNSLPMCGVPYKAYEQYLNKLTSAGYKVAICEQLEDPAKAKARWILQGHKDPDRLLLERAAPTPMTLSLMLAFQLLASLNYELELGDDDRRRRRRPPPAGLLGDAEVEVVPRAGDP